jgi:predicted transcriptional regulator
MRNIPKNITKDLLENLYIKEGKSFLDIAKILNKSIAQISRYLKRFEIPARAFSTKGLHNGLGNILSKETKDKIRQKHLGMKMSVESSEKKRKWMLKNNPFRGKKHTEESKQKQREKMTGRKLTPEHRAKVITTLIMGDVKGEKSHGWRGGVSPINARLRSTKEYMSWNKQVKERDDYTCLWCGLKSKSNHADHIKSFIEFPELRHSLDNGRTLCAKCHRKTETYGNKSRTLSE